MDDHETISAIVLTKNEEKNLDRCLSSVQFCDEIIIVDDYSTDKTLEIAKKYTNTIVQHKLNGDFTQQRNFGMELAKSKWVFFIDADEEASRELDHEIQRALNDKKFEKRAYYIPRRDFWWGRELRYGEVYDARRTGLIRLVKKNSGKWSGKVHERYLIGAFVGRLKSFINHYPHPTLKEFIHDVNVYSSIRARELFQDNKSVGILEIMIIPFGKFFVNYFLRLGFLDGPAGFTYIFLMSFHSFLVRAKLYQYRNFPKNNVL